MLSAHGIVIKADFGYLALDASSLRWGRSDLFLSLHIILSFLSFPFILYSSYLEYSLGGWRISYPLWKPAKPSFTQNPFFSTMPQLSLEGLSRLIILFFLPFPFLPPFSSWSSSFFYLIQSPPPQLFFWSGYKCHICQRKGEKILYQSYYEKSWAWRKYWNYLGDLSRRLWASLWVLMPRNHNF